MASIPQSLPAVNAAAPQQLCPVKTEAAPTEAHVDLEKFMQSEGGDYATVCPFWNVAINTGLVHPDAQGNVSIAEMRNALAFVGAKFGIREAAIAGVKNVLGPMLGVTGFFASQGLDHINVYDLKNSPLVHNGDSGILRHGFNQARLDRLLSYSSDGERVTLSDLAAANKDQIAKDPGEHGHTLGSAEYTLLVTAFGFTDESGDKYLNKKDLTTIYKDQKFPDGWENREWGAVRAGLNVAEFVNDQKKLPDDPQPPGVVDSNAAAAGAKKSGGVCPFLNGSMFTAEEAAKQHADKLPSQPQQQ